MAFKIVRNDITKVEADIIVNTANPKPKCVSGTDLAIYEAAGKEALLAEEQLHETDASKLVDTREEEKIEGTKYKDFVFEDLVPEHDPRLIDRD